MAPEMVTGKQKQGTAMDWWALGVMLFEMMLGTLPFNARLVDNDVAVFRSIVNAKIAFPRNHKLSHSAVDFIEQLLRKVRNGDGRRLRGRYGGTWGGGCGVIISFCVLVRYCYVWKLSFFALYMYPHVYYLEAIV